MVENLAQQTANQIVDKMVGAEPNKVENAYALLADKLYTDVYKSDPSTQAGLQFVTEVFTDVNAQYATGKAVPGDLALAWATQQTGHELPATGFSQSDLKNVQASTDPHVTILDKAMAGALLNNYSNFQEEVEHDAANRIINAHECTEEKQQAADYIKKWGTPEAGTLPGIVLQWANCNDKVDPADPERMAGVVREVPAAYIQASLKSMDAYRPMEFPF